MLCKDDYFHHLSGLYDYPLERREDLAREHICTLCGIKSRAELDTNEAAAALFEKLFRKYDTHVYAKQQGFIE